MRIMMDIYGNHASLMEGLTRFIPVLMQFEMIKKWPEEGEKGREQLNSFIKQVRQNGLALDELVAAISAFESITSIATGKISPAYGSLLSHLFAQLEANWRGEAFHVDIRSVQLVLLKRIFKRGAAGNLAIWTAALREIRMLSERAKGEMVEWVLEGCKEAEEADWPVIFHNLLAISPVNAVFAGLYSCLDDTGRNGLSRKQLLDHLVFLIGQNGALGRAWIKWVLSRGCFEINPLVFSGLLSLSQDTEYYNVLNGAMVTMIKTMNEVWREVSGVEEFKRMTVDPAVYLGEVAGWIGSDSEAEIRGALHLIDNLNEKNNEEVARSFYLQLFQKHPFARRELLKKLHRGFSSKSFWIKLAEFDEIILKEFAAREDGGIMWLIVKDAPELLGRLIDSEDQLESAIDGANCDPAVIRALMAIESILVGKAIKRNSHLRMDNNLRYHGIQITDWRSVSPLEISLLKNQAYFESECHRFVELCELLLLPGGVEENLMEDLIDLALEFVAGSSNMYSAKEQLHLVSKLIAAAAVEKGSGICCGSYEKVFGLLNSNGVDLSGYHGTLKYLLERVNVASEEFYRLIPRVPGEFHGLVARAICRFEGKIEMGLEVRGLICSLAGRVVSEPQLSKALIALLSRGYHMNGSHRLSAGVFGEISDPVIWRAIIDFGFNNVIEGFRDELIKSLLMYYGIIEDGDGDAGDTNISSTVSKFKNLHLNEKSVNYALMSLLANVQGELTIAHKLLKSHVALFDRNPNEFLRAFVMPLGTEMFLGLTRGLISGKGAIKMHGLLASFYDLCGKLLKNATIDKDDCDLVELKELMRIVGGQLNKQVYALIPLQQEKLQSQLKQDLNLKKGTVIHKKSNHHHQSSNGRSVTKLVFEMEKFEEGLIAFLRARGWNEKIVRSTARDFKIKLEQL